MALEGADAIAFFVWLNQDAWMRSSTSTGWLMVGAYTAAPRGTYTLACISASMAATVTRPHLLRAVSSSSVTRTVSMGSWPFLVQCTSSIDRRFPGGPKRDVVGRSKVGLSCPRRAFGVFDTRDGKNQVCKTRVSTLILEAVITASNVGWSIPQ